MAADSGGGERRRAVVGRVRAVVGRVRAVVGQRAVSGGGGGGAGGRRSCATGLVRAARRHLGGISSGSWPRLANQPVDRLHVVLVLLCLPRAGGADARSDGRGCRKRSGGRGCRPRDLGAIYVAACMRVHSYPNQPQYLGTISTASRSNLGRNSISRMCECTINPQISAAYRLHLGRISAASRPHLGDMSSRRHLGGISAAPGQPFRLASRRLWTSVPSVPAGKAGRQAWHIDGAGGAVPRDVGTISARSRCNLGTISLRSRHGLGTAQSRCNLGAISARSWRNPTCSNCPTPSPERPWSESSGAAEDEAEPGDCPATATCQCHTQQPGLGVRCRCRCRCSTRAHARACTDSVAPAQRCMQLADARRLVPTAGRACLGAPCPGASSLR